MSHHPHSESFFFKNKINWSLVVKKQVDETKLCAFCALLEVVPFLSRSYVPCFNWMSGEETLGGASRNYMEMVLVQCWTRISMELRKNRYITPKFYQLMLLGSFEFYDISTLVDYLMPNPVIYIYIYIYVFLNQLNRTRKLFKIEHLNFPGKELNVTDITEQ